MIGEAIVYDMMSDKSRMLLTDKGEEKLVKVYPEAERGGGTRLKSNKFKIHVTRVK